MFTQADLKEKLYAGVKVDGWQTTNCEVAYVMNSEFVTQAQATIERYIAWFRSQPVREETWSMQMFNIPCLWLRLDCVFIGGRLHIFEVEDRSAGIGSMLQISTQFQTILDDVRNSWPKFKYLRSPLHSGSDDSLWLEAVQDDTCANANELVLVRSEPHENEMWRLAPRSVGPIKSEGDKSYGLEMGLWTILSSVEQFDPKKAQAIKLAQCSKSRGVKLFKPGSSKARPAGCISAGAAMRFIEEAHASGKTVFTQPLVDPPVCELGNYMLRPFFLYDIRSNEWVHAGGEWLATNNYRLHGGSSTVFGPLTLPSDNATGIRFNA